MSRTFGATLVAAGVVISAIAVSSACSSSGSSTGTTKPKCTKDTDCVGGNKCVNGQCTGAVCGSSGQPCCTGSACNTGLVCNPAGTCEIGSSNCGALNQACCANDTCNTGLNCNAGACKSGGGTMGSPCTKNGDCPSGLCTPIEVGIGVDPKNACTINCTVAGDCVPGWTCDLVSGGHIEGEKVCKCKVSHEICDELDNDCDGVVDNKPDGECIYLLASERASDIAVDATSLYYTTYEGTGAGTGNKGVRKVALAGGEPVTLAQAPEPTYDKPRAIAIDATNVYWASETAAGYIIKVPKDGGTAVTLVSKEDSPQQLALDGKNVYFTTNYTFDGCCSAGTVKSVPLGGGTITTLMPQKTYTSPEGIAVDANWVYFGDTNIGELWKIAIGGGTPISMSKTSSVYPEILIDATTLYYSGKGTILKLPLDAVDGGTSTTISPGSAISIAKDDTHIYWTEPVPTAPYSGLVKRVPIAGGTPETIASGQGEPDAIAVDATNVYWTTSTETGTGRILKRIK